MEHENNHQAPLRIGITHGDVNGIGYEIMLKTFGDARMQELFTPVIYGSSKVASYHKKTIDGGEIHFQLIRTADQAQAGKVNMVNITSKEIKIDLGKSTAQAGEAALLALEMAVEEIRKGWLDALVTAPINKHNIQGEHFGFPGHTEYLANRFDSPDCLMLMISNNMRIGVVTGHIPISEVPGGISRKLILKKLQIMNESLVKDFGIRKPRIAVLALNPHAGDEGVIGNEEKEVIIPAIKQAFDDGIMAFGPYPADGFFGSSSFSTFDGILAMYHDQGLIPFKTMSFSSGVNFTAGLPIVRTSPAHGTAYDIAGKNIASPDMFREAIYMAIDIVRNRRIYEEISADPLKFSVLEEDSDADKNELKNLPDEPVHD